MYRNWLDSDTTIWAWEKEVDALYPNFAVKDSLGSGPFLNQATFAACNQVLDSLRGSPWQPHLAQEIADVFII